MLRFTAALPSSCPLAANICLSRLSRYRGISDIDHLNPSESFHGSDGPYYRMERAASVSECFSCPSHESPRWASAFSLYSSDSQCSCIRAGHVQSPSVSSALLPLARSSKLPYPAYANTARALDPPTPTCASLTFPDGTSPVAGTDSAALLAGPNASDPVLRYH
ncbi:hypothetical protein BV25DRAFT_1022148 [Artomyces pyxidatus]|uniref:Uncharacterized protein n=1 Tax=Artomyces pyxidatus TaxID=48021 RepID=A0ACB8SVR6_9AGAM|nr:hypothetical protein BV25DRAFT_1022148 [Artomyces pyxidatus]